RGPRGGAAAWAPPNQRGGTGWESTGREPAGARCEKCDDPQEPRPVDRRASPPAPGRLGPWGASAPRGTPVAFPRTTRESPVLRPEAAWTSPRDGRLRVPTVRDAPSGPVSPSSGNSYPDFPVLPRRPLGAERNLGGGQASVKATFPLVRRVCPGRDG